MADNYAEEAADALGMKVVYQIGVGGTGDPSNGHLPVEEATDHPRWRCDDDLVIDVSAIGPALFSSMLA